MEILRMQFHFIKWGSETNDTLCCKELEPLCKGPSASSSSLSHLSIQLTDEKYTGGKLTRSSCKDQYQKIPWPISVLTLRLYVVQARDDLRVAEKKVKSCCSEICPFRMLWLWGFLFLKEYKASLRAVYWQMGYVVERGQHTPVIAQPHGAINSGGKHCSTRADGSQHPQWPRKYALSLGHILQYSQWQARVVMAGWPINFYLLI